VHVDAIVKASLDLVGVFAFKGRIN